MARASRCAGNLRARHQPKPTVLFPDVQASNACSRCEPIADFDLVDIWEYIAADNIDAADRWIDKLFVAFEALGRRGGQTLRRDIFPAVHYALEFRTSDGHSAAIADQLESVQSAGESEWGRHQLRWRPHRPPPSLHNAIAGQPFQRFFGSLDAARADTQHGDRANDLRAERLAGL
jgi:plasmid stabilization system protein ParE